MRLKDENADLKSKLKRRLEELEEKQSGCLGSEQTTGTVKEFLNENGT